MKNTAEWSMVNGEREDSDHALTIRYSSFAIHSTNPLQ